MERHRLKNIIILILALLNALLLASLAMRGSDALTARHAARDQLVQLFASDGIALDPDCVTDQPPLPPYTLAREDASERKVVSFLLGERAERSDLGGGIASYTSSAGAALFRDSGNFDFALSASERDASEVCRDFCKRFQYAAPVFDLDDSGSGSAEARRLWNGVVVTNCDVMFTIEEGCLTAVSGVLLPESGTEVADAPPLLSAFAALTEFQKMRQSSGIVVSVVSGLAFRYELQSTSASALTLTPFWCVTTDTAIFYVNCITGEVRRA